MAETIRHLGDVLQELFDDRLDPAHRAEAEAHLAQCDTCRRELAALRWTKTGATRLQTADVPPGLADRIRAALDDEPRQTSAGPRPHRRSNRLAWAAALAAALLLAVWLWPRSGTAIPAQVADDYRAFTTGELRLGLVTDDVTAVAAYFQRTGVPATRVFGFAGMNYNVTGGLAHRLAGRPSALFTYEGPAGQILVCQMYEGRLDELSSEGERRTYQGIDFRIYRNGGVTLVFWQEDEETVCVLAGDADPETVFQLAYAKAAEGRARP